MKRVFVLAAVAASISISACAQKMDASKVPDAVKASFAKNYPGTKVSWEKEKSDYEAGFKKDGHSMSAVFTADGTMLESEVDIQLTELPKAATEHVKTNYPNKKIKEAAKITKADGTVTYEAEVEGKDLIFDETGKFIKAAKD